MRLLAFTDIHGDKKAIKAILGSVKKDDPDILVCAGDLSNFGDNLSMLINAIKSVKKPLLIIHGNHEDYDELKALCENIEDCVCMHKKILRLGGYLFIGMGGGGFLSRDSEFERFVENKKNELLKGEKIILITHGPVYNTKVDMIHGLGHRGCKSYRRFIDKYNPIVAICGHFHETFGKFDEVNNTLVINPGKAGKILEF